jgi:hypothetical protein
MPQSERMAPLEALIGKWTTTITMLGTDGGVGEVSEATDTYSWSANGMFVQHDVDATMDGERALSFEIIAADPDGDGFVTRSYDPDGTFSDFTAALDGRNWSITGAVQRFRGAFSEDGQTLSGRWEQNDGSGNWAPLMDVTLRK